MKGSHSGNRCLYTDQRDSELNAAYNRAKARLLKEKGHINQPDAVDIARCSPASRFFISEFRATIMISKMDAHFECVSLGIPESSPDYVPNPLDSISRYQTRRMYECLYDVYCTLRDKNPDTPLIELVIMATAHPAPEFFLTSGSARAILGYIRVNSRRFGVRSSNQSKHLHKNK